MPILFFSFNILDRKTLYAGRYTESAEKIYMPNEVLSKIK